MTPAQKAGLFQTAESLAVTAVVTGLWAIVPLVYGSGPLDWHIILMVFGLAVLFSLVHGVLAYAKAYNANLDTVLEKVVDSLEQRIQKNVPMLQPPQSGSIIATPTPPPAQPASPLVVIHAAPAPTTAQPQVSETKPPQV